MDASKQIKDNFVGCAHGNKAIIDHVGWADIQLDGDGEKGGGRSQGA